VALAVVAGVLGAAVWSMAPAAAAQLARPIAMPRAAMGAAATAAPAVLVLAAAILLLAAVAGVQLLWPDP
jgi:hypothetical protein